ncbi:MAG TPA: hypothetical protein EYP14_01450 [Planctomycetaceae bacterium]|nr:hypothetical protein [Planctomycetaceae bacterium]
MNWLWGSKYTPIGLDIGTDTIKLVQLELSGPRPRVVALAQRRMPELDEEADEPQRSEQLKQAVAALLSESGVRGRQVTLCMNGTQVFVQNLRVPAGAEEQLEGIVQTEAEQRLPGEFGEVEIRHLLAGEVRGTQHGGEPVELKHEVIMLACRRRDIDSLIALAERLRLKPQGLDVPQCALARVVTSTMRRKSDEHQCLLILDLGASGTNVIVTRGQSVLMIKPLPIGGRLIDRQVAKRLDLSLPDAAALRQQCQDQPDQIEDELLRVVDETVRAHMEALGREVIRCVRYHSVTFRGSRIAKALLFGGEANQAVAGILARRIGITCELGDPFVGLELSDELRRRVRLRRVGMWAVVLGLCTKARRVAA